jgi:hypothetical protein
MATLAILQRSDRDIALVVATEDATALAYRLGEQQSFEVQVFAAFPHKAGLLPVVQNTLRALHLANGWYAAHVEEAVAAVCKASAQNAEQQPEEVGASVPEDTCRERADPGWQALLEPCARQEADKATTIRRTLKRLLGRWQAEAVLSTHKESCLRIGGGCGRYIVNGQGETLRLVGHAKEASH